MARQASEDTHHPFSGFYEWHKRWLEERARYPSYMEVRINEHLWQNKEVFVFIFPDTDRRDSLGCFADPRYRDKGYEIPMCVVYEPLSEESRSHLNMLLSPIMQLQGVDYREALAFSVQIFLMFVDYQRAMQEEESVLFRPTSEQFLYTTEGLIRIVQIVNSPMLTLEALFKFWGIIGVHFASGFYKSPDASLVQPTYLTIPPTWLTVDQLKEIYGDEAETRRIPLLVEPAYKAPMENLLRFFRATRQAGVPLHVNFGLLSKADQVDSMVEQYVFRQEGDFWTIVYQGERLPPLKGKSLRYIAFLLQHSRQAFSTPSAFVAAVEKKDASIIVESHHQLAEALLANGHVSQRGEMDTGPVLDTRGKRALAQRRDDLNERLEAYNFANPGHAAEMRAEVEAINAYLASNTGLGGKSRKSGDLNEQARQAVSQAIHRSLKKIEKHHPGLADHLRRTLTPLRYPLCYAPDPPIAWVT